MENQTEDHSLEEKITVHKNGAAYLKENAFDPVRDYAKETWREYAHEFKKARHQINEEGIWGYFEYRMDVRSRAKRLKEHKLKEFREEIAQKLRTQSGMVLSEWEISRLSRIPKPYTETRFARLGIVARNLSMGVGNALTGMGGVSAPYLEALCIATGTNRKLQTAFSIGLDYFWGISGAIAMNETGINADNFAGAMAWTWITVGAIQPVVRTAYYAATNGRHSRSYTQLLSPNIVASVTAWGLLSKELYRKYNIRKDVKVI